MKLDINAAKSRIEPPSPINFVSDLEKGIVHDKRDQITGVWRVSSLVQLWGSTGVNTKREKALDLYLTSGESEEFESETVKRFHMGTSVHEVVKDYFRRSKHFKVLHEELPIKHKTLPILGTMDLVLEWDRMPKKELIVEIKSVESTYHNNPIWGSKIKPFKKARWQAGLYSTIYGAPVMVLYYCKDNSEMICHFLDRSDYGSDVDEIIAACEKVWNETKVNRKP